MLSIKCALEKAGGIYQRGVENFAPFAVSDGRLVTGQNPASSEKMATMVLEAMSNTN